MSLYDYAKARRLGRRQYQGALLKGEYPYLPVLDEILANTKIVSEVNLGIVDIPLERIVGTKTSGRTQAFSNQFMPLLGEKTEFGSKWAYLIDHQIEDGIVDPIVAYEFMNRYYVQEGNKRVSVLKFLGAHSITASVLRLIPKRSDDMNNRIYYEFLDFYEVSQNSDIWFSKEGSYVKLLNAMNKDSQYYWNDDDKQYFKAAYDKFSKVFHEIHTDEMELTTSDAFLIYMEIFDYDVVKEKTEDAMRKDLAKLKSELRLAAFGGEIELIEQPQEAVQETGMINWLLPGFTTGIENLKPAFIHFGNKEESSWVYGHELGRMYLEQVYGDKFNTKVYEDVMTESELEEAIAKALKAGCNMIFTTASQMINETVKTALQNPQVKMFNCSVHMSYSSVSTYYARMYESKFLMGALAAALDETGQLGYVADYPIYGTLSNINAFAFGAQMINPRAKIHLKWSKLQKTNWKEEFELEGVSFISGEDMITPNSASREYGLYEKLPDGSVENYATPMFHWGKFYEKIMDLTCKGNLDAKNLKGKKALNYWWGMSADVIDVICSSNIPNATARLIEFLKKSIKNGTFQPFDGPFCDQNGKVKCKVGETLSPEEIVSMDWLAKNVIGSIPDAEEFIPKAQEFVRLQGVKHQ